VDREELCVRGSVVSRSFSPRTGLVSQLMGAPRSQFMCGRLGPYLSTAPRPWPIPQPGASSFAIDIAECEELHATSEPRPLLLLHSRSLFPGGKVKTPTELTQLFRDRCLKITRQRQCIFRVLEDNSSHPTAHTVYESVREEMPNISLRTVYQTLNDLVALGEIQQVDAGTGAARFDPVTGSHHHLVCTECGAMRDVHDDFVGLRLPARKRQGFSISGTEVIFRGLCADCSQPTSRQRDGERKQEDRHA
jgi:Fur family transcriptional regulator, peroxide stress response regulator